MFIQVVFAVSLDTPFDFAPVQNRPHSRLNASCPSFFDMILRMWLAAVQSNPPVSVTILRICSW